jgi:hypothetical protein
MSISVMSRVWTYSKAERGDLLVMLAIADFANDDGDAWPSIKVLGTKSRIKERQVHYALNKLCRLGELEIVPNAGPNRCNLYRVLVPEKRVHSTAGVQKMHSALNGQEGALDGKKRVHSTAPKPSIEPSKEPSGPPGRRPRSEKELVAYAVALGFPASDGTHFWNKQEAGGWMRGKEPIKNWQACFRTHRDEGWLLSQKNGPKQSGVRNPL